MPTTEQPAEAVPETRPQGPFVILNANRPGADLWDHARCTRYRSETAAWRFLYRHHRHYRPSYLRGIFGVRPVTWKEREQDRFRDGTYTKPVWDGERWWRDRPGVLIQHYAHVSTEDPKQIAFTEDAAKGEANRKTRMKAGKYLRKYFGQDADYAVLTDKQIAYMAEWQARGQPPEDPSLKALKLQFASTPDEIEEVYRYGPASCMSESMSECTRVYGAGDLAIAYLDGTEVDGFGPGSPLSAHGNRRKARYPARAIVWPERKAMGRIYPTPGDYWSRDGYESHDEAAAMQEELHSRLKALGYVSEQEKGGQFIGARLLAERREDEDTEDGEAYAMPYIDWFPDIRGPLGGHFYIGAVPAEVEGGGDAEYCTAGSTSGHIVCTVPFVCPMCGEDEAERVQAAITLNRDGSNVLAYDRAYCCDGCVSEHAYSDAVTGRRVASEAYPPVEMSNRYGESISHWNPLYFRTHGFTCRHDGRNYERSGMSARFPGYHSRYDADVTVHPPEPQLFAEPVTDPIVAEVYGQPLRHPNRLSDSELADLLRPPRRQNGGYGWSTTPGAGEFVSFTIQNNANPTTER